MVRGLYKTPLNGARALNVAPEERAVAHVVLRRVARVVPEYRVQLRRALLREPRGDPPRVCSVMITA